MEWITVVCALGADIALLVMLVSALVDAKRYSYGRNIGGWLAVCVLVVMGTLMVLALLQQLGVMRW